MMLPESAAWDVLRLVLAYALAFPIGWDREREDRSAGLRTFPIVAVAACAFTILGTSIPGATADSYSRVLQGLITGIGFIGGGAILHAKGTVKGTATAASIWSIGIVGAAVGFWPVPHCRGAHRHQPADPARARAAQATVGRGAVDRAPHEGASTSRVEQR